MEQEQRRRGTDGGLVCLYDRMEAEDELQYIQTFRSGTEFFKLERKEHNGWRCDGAGRSAGHGTDTDAAECGCFAGT